jgi:hypothetical protein
MRNRVAGPPVLSPAVRSQIKAQQLHQGDWRHVGDTIAGVGLRDRGLCLPHAAAYELE